MLTLSRRCDYALIALTHLGRSPEDVSSAREIAHRYRVPLPLLMNILKQLTRQGIVSSVRGARGGYKLAQSAGDITMQRVLEAVDGPVRLVRCADTAPGQETCERVGLCPMRTTARKLHNRFSEFLDQVTLAEMIGADGQAGRSRPLDE